MAELSITKYHDSEISKVDDFNYTAEEAILFSNAIMDQIFSDVENSFIVSGLLVTATSPVSMGVNITPGIGMNKVYS